MLDALRHRRRMAHVLESHAQVYLLRTGLALGLFEALRTPRGERELAERLALAPDLVGAWLRAAHAQGLLRLDGERYALDEFARALLDGGEAYHAMLEQAAHSVGPVLDRLPELLKGSERPAFGTPEEAARAATTWRVVADRALAALAQVPGAAEARRVLDIGCGHGAYLVGWLGRHRDAHGVGIEIDAAVAEEARRHVREADVARRCEIRVGDFMNMELPPGTFDLVLLNNNLHYFAPGEHPALFRRVLERITAGGVLAIQSPVVSVNRVSRFLGTASASALLDLMLRSHRNLHGLPDPAAVESDLRAAGFADTGQLPVIPGGTAVYVWGRAG